MPTEREPSLGSPRSKSRPALTRSNRQIDEGMNEEMSKHKSRIAALIVRIAGRACICALWTMLALVVLAGLTIAVVAWTTSHDWSPLHIAVNRGDVRQTKTLLRAGADPDSVDGLGRSPVHLAAEVANRPALKELLGAGADPGIMDGRGYTPLHLAARRGDREGLALLLEAGADPNARGLDRATPLHLATRSGIADPVLELIEAGADPLARRAGGDTPLHVSASAGDAAVLGVLMRAELASGAEGNDKWHPLERLARTRRAQIALALLRAGASLAPENDRGLSPLQVARQRISVLDRHGRTALHVAAIAGDTTLARTLAEAGVPPDRRAEGVLTPLQTAASRGHAAVAQVLIEAGSDLDARDADGRTALTHAVQHGHLEVARLLRDSGAGTSATTIPWPPPTADASDFPPSMALHWAAWLGDTDMLSRLLESGLQPGVRDREARTPLHVAAGEGHLEAVRVLLEAGADTQAEDHASWMPVTTAAMHGHADIVREIESAAQPDGARSFRLSAHMNWVQEMAGLLGHDAVAAMDLWRRHDWASWSWMDNDPATAGTDAAHGPSHGRGTEQALLEERAAADAVGDDGATPLHLAVLADDVREVRKLLAAGADPDVRSRHWGTALALAIRRSGTAVVTALLDAGADPNGRDPEGRPLLWVTENIGDLQALLGAGADPNARWCGQTALHEAARSGEDARALVLLRAGADPLARARHYFGWTPLQMAANWGSLGTTRLLKLATSRFGARRLRRDGHRESLP